MTRVLIVSATRLYREGLELLLTLDGEIETVAAVDDAPAALRALHAELPDVTLIDGAMHDAVALTRTVVTSGMTRVVVVGVADSDRDVIAFAEAGVAGFVTRDADSKTLRTAITAAARGETPCSPTIVAALLKRIAALAPSNGIPDPTTLTRREREIVELIGEGLSNKEIAGRLYIQAATVKNHVHRILEKLEVGRRSEIAGVMREAVLRR